MGGPLDLVQLHTNETSFKLHHDQIVHNKTQLTHEVGGSLAARAPVAFGGGDGEAETAGSSPASAGCFFFLIGSLRGRGMMEMCANGTEDVLVRHFVC